NLNMTGNSGPLASTTDNLVGSGVLFAGIGLRKQGAVANVNAFNIQGITANPTNLQVQQFVGGNNHSADGTGGPVSGVDIISGSNYGTTNAVPLLLASSSSATRSTVAGSGAHIAAMSPVPDWRQLESIREAAISQWLATDLTAAQAQVLPHLTFEAVDLPVGSLAELDGDRLRIDVDGAGAGWFIDAAPASTRSFTDLAPPPQSDAQGRNDAAGRVDLLTVVMHEMGHRLGYADSYDATDRDNLMYGYLSAGERRVPPCTVGAVEHLAAARSHMLSLGSCRPDMFDRR